MQRAQLNTLITLCAAALLTAGTCLAGQTPAPSTSPAPASGSTAPAAKTQTTKPAAKPGTTASKTAPAPLTTQKQKVSYAIGLNIGKSMKKDGVEVDSATLLRGLKDGMAGATPALTDEEAQKALTQLRADLTKKADAERLAAATKNKKEGDDFLAANKAKEGVKTTADGLQYKVITAGTGPKPTAADTVTVNYRGTLLNGKEFDSSYKRGQPATFPVGQIIKGWTEALQLMPVGSKWQLFIPPDLAYGDRPAGPDIGPNSTLIFEVELLSIAPKTDAAPKAPGMAPAPQGQAKPEPQSQPQR
jgi:FKBP-type peptidyl-prolyl cis-trans isomerase FklB